MHDYLLSIFLGVVEGLTEFLPVSSTAHLRTCEALLRIDLHDGFWKMYTIVIQLGAILALPVFCRDRNSGVGPDETDRQKLGKPLGNGIGASHRWNHHVDR